MTPKFARGGIGDLLLCLESAIDATEIDVYSHYRYAPDIFTPFGVKVNRFEYFQTLDALNACYIMGEQLAMNPHPSFTVPPAPFNKPKGTIVGVHIEGSTLSNDFWTKRGKPTKNMSNDFLIKLVKEIQFTIPRVVIYVFCDPVRRDEVGQLLAPEIAGDYYMIAFSKIWDSLACVDHCSYVIGMDSAIKSMSAILSIPTITLVGDYPDEFRDATFLTPYEQEGIMRILKFTDIDQVNPRDITQHLLL